MSIPFILVAKAGGSDEAPENTCAAVTAALAVALPPETRLAVEVDVRRSADDALVVFHDAELGRTTNGVGRVNEHPLHALRELRAGPHGERIPVLEEVSELLGEHELVVEAHDADLRGARALVKALGRLGRSARDRVLVASEHTLVVHAVRELAPGVRTAATARAVWCKVLLERAKLERWAPRGHPFIVPVAHRGLSVVTRRFARAAAAVGDEVWAYVVNDATEVRRLRNLGVTGCFTTRPAALAAALRGGSRDGPGTLVTGAADYFFKDSKRIYR